MMGVGCKSNQILSIICYIWVLFLVKPVVICDLFKAIWRVQVVLLHAGYRFVSGKVEI